MVLFFMRRITLVPVTVFSLLIATACSSKRPAPDDATVDSPPTYPSRGYALGAGGGADGLVEAVVATILSIGDPGKYAKSSIWGGAGLDAALY